MAGRKKGRGGYREGAGRKPLTGRTRRNRVVTLLDETEYRALLEYAEEKGLPVSTAAYKILARFLRRRR